MTATLIRNANVYAPEPLGRRDLLLGGGKVLWIGTDAPDLPAAFGAQTLDLGPDISPLKRFQVYPHIDKAFEAMARGDGTRAIAELEHAHRLAPENTAIALHLAQAYQRFGQPARAARPGSQRRAVGLRCRWAGVHGGLLDCRP